MDFEILETMALCDGSFVNLDRHLNRLKNTAQHFSFPYPVELINQTLQLLQKQHPKDAWRIRLTLNQLAQLQVQAQPLAQVIGPVCLRLAQKPLPNEVVQSDWVRFKTTNRAHYEALQSPHTDAFDTVLYNEEGEITEGARSNIAVLLDGHWITPPLRCGLLAGVGREVALESGKVREQVLLLDDLPRVQSWAFINSLRGWLNAYLKQDIN